MEIRIRETGAVITDSEFRAMQPNTSFPPILTVDILDAFGADAVMNGPTPTADRYQTIVRDGIQEINGKWFTKFIAVDMPQEAKDALDISHAAIQRSERNRRLAETDWTQVEDAPVDKTAWAAYRQQLRELPNQQGFPWEVDWPVPPA